MDAIGHRLSTMNNLSMHKICYNTSVNPQTIEKCIDTHGIECATEVDDQQMMALHILVCVNPFVTGDAIGFNIFEGIPLL